MAEFIPPPHLLAILPIIETKTILLPILEISGPLRQSELFKTHGVGFDMKFQELAKCHVREDVISKVGELLGKEGKRVSLISGPGDFGIVLFDKAAHGMYCYLIMIYSPSYPMPTSLTNDGVSEYVLIPFLLGCQSQK